MNGRKAGKARGKARGKAPVSSHPLFPAIVALWFGAAFGLGSLAIRASLLESAVLAARLDLLVPAAAPPLGLTARILLALLLALVGGVIGAVLARWIARPGPVSHQRRRATVAPAEPVQVRSRDAHPDAPARRPISAHDEFGAAEIAGPDAQDRDGPALIPGRRRALAIEGEHEPTYHHELAPLPGGAPQILDINQIARPAPLLLEDDDADDEGGELELDRYAPFGRAPLSAHDLMAAPTVAASPVESPFAPPVEMAAEPEAPQWQAAPAADVAAPPAFAPLSFAAPVDAQRPFAAPQAAAPFAAPLAEPAPAEPAQAAPINRLFDSSGIAAAAPLPRFAAPAAPFAGPDGDAAPAPYSVAQFFDTAAPLFAEPAAEAPEAEAPEVETPEAEIPAFVAAPAPAMAAPPARALDNPAAVNPLEAAPLAELGQVELIERLAMAMQKRRARADVPPIPDFAAALGLSPQDLSPPPVPPFARLETQSEPAPVMPAREAEAAAPAFESPAFELPAASLAAPMAMPAALRPIGFDDEDDQGDDQDEGLADILPPRAFAMPAATGPVLAALADDAPEAGGADAGDSVEDEDDDEDAAYSSLLDLPRAVPAKQPFIRIEEAEAAFEAIEPVVIFPGQTARAPFAAPAPAHAQAPAAAPFTPAFVPESEAPSAPTVLRRFDAPGSTASAAQTVSASPVSLTDPEETERALRSALATLQRMSGAA